MRFSSSTRRSICLTYALAAVVLTVTLFATAPAHAQLIFTEIMFEPGGDDALWEWVEVRNTSNSPVNLDGWVFDDEVLVG
jgi:P pilus assembly chaperone PapD